MTDSSAGNFSAQLLGDGTKITCNSYSDGLLLNTNVSAGPYAVVSCG